MPRQAHNAYASFFYSFVRAYDCTAPGHFRARWRNLSLKAGRGSIELIDIIWEGYLSTELAKLLKNEDLRELSRVEAANFV